MLTLSPSCFGCCAHLSPRIAIVFSLSFRVVKFIHIASFYWPYLHPVPFLLADVTFSHNVISTLFFLGARTHLCILLLPTTGIPLLSGRSRSPTRNRSFSVFTKSVLPCNCVFIPISSLTPPYIFQCSSFFTLFLSACLSLRSIISFISVLYAQTYLWT